MVGPERIGRWIGRLEKEHAKNGGEFTVEKAKTMLALSVCIAEAAKGYLIRYQESE